MKNLVIILIFGLLVSLALFLINPFSLGNDYPSYEKTALSHCVFCDPYKPMVNWFLIPFSHLGGQVGIRFGVSFLMGFLPILGLFLITRESWSAWFYVSISSYLTFISTSAVIGQAMIGLLLIAYFLISKWNYRFLILAMAFFTHLWGFYVIFLMMLIDFLQQIKTKELFSIGVCSPFWGKELPKIINQTVTQPATNIHTIFTFNNLLSFFVKIVPLPFLVFSIRELWNKKQYSLLAIIPISLIGAIFLNPRTLYMAAIPMIIGFSMAFKDLELKKTWLFLSFLQFALLMFFASRLFLVKC